MDVGRAGNRSTSCWSGDEGHRSLRVKRREFVRRTSLLAFQREITPSGIGSWRSRESSGRYAASRRRELPKNTSVSRCHERSVIPRWPTAFSVPIPHRCNARTWPPRRVAPEAVPVRDRLMRTSGLFYRTLARGIIVIPCRSGSDPRKDEGQWEKKGRMIK